MTFLVDTTIMPFQMHLIPHLTSHFNLHNRNEKQKQNKNKNKETFTPKSVVMIMVQAALPFHLHSKKSALQVQDTGTRVLDNTKPF